MAILAQVCSPCHTPQFFSLLDAMSRVVSGAGEVVKVPSDDESERAAAIIERTTAAASAAMADGGAMMALQRLQELVDEQAANAVESPIEGWNADEGRSATSYAPSFSGVQPVESEEIDHPLAGLKEEVMAAGKKRPAPEMEPDGEAEINVDEVIEEMVNKVRPSPRRR